MEIGTTPSENEASLITSKIPLLHLLLVLLMIGGMRKKMLGL